MQITEEQLTRFILQYGGKYDVTFKNIEEVGVDKVLAGASTQLVASTVAYDGVMPCGEEHADATKALHDYFGDGGFDALCDRVWSCWP